MYIMYFNVMKTIGPILGMWCLSLNYQNCTNPFNPCYAVTHFQSTHSTNLYIGVAFDPPLTMDVLQPLFSLIPLLLFWFCAKVNHGHLRFQTWRFRHLHTLVFTQDVQTWCRLNKSNLATEFNHLLYFNIKKMKLGPRLPLAFPRGLGGGEWSVHQ